MRISLTSSSENGFKKWSDEHPAGNDDDDNSGGATPIAVTEPPDDGHAPIEEPAYRPSLVPGNGSSF